MQRLFVIDRVGYIWGDERFREGLRQKLLFPGLIHHNKDRGYSATLIGLLRPAN
jgi:hypothetical protein